MGRGRLRIYLGAAPGVGKTFAMLNEGRRRASRGTDVVVGWVETHGRENTAAQLGGLEVLPRRRMTHRGATFEEMDVDALLARNPQVALVDEFAHTNVPGSRHEKRWQDVVALLDAGIDVVSTVNIQHLESVNDVVERITGVKQNETVPDAVVRRAEQIELVDMTPEALRRRMAHGNIYAAEKVDAALGNYFRVGNLGALRELALLWVADRVDESLHGYMADHGIEDVWETRERVVVAVTGAPSGESLIRRAARIASRARADLLGLHVRTDDGLSHEPGELLLRHRRLLADLGGEYHEVVGTDVVDAMLGFARAEKATQLVLGASRRSRWGEVLRGSVINRVIRGAGHIDVHVISPDGGPAVEQTSLARDPRRARLPRRRVQAAWLLTVVGLPLLTFAMTLMRDSLNLPTEMLVYLLFVVGVAVLGGFTVAMVAAVAASLLVNWFFTTPIHTFTIAEVENAIAVAVFLAVAATVSLLVTRIAQRSAEALRARAEVEALSLAASGAVGAPDPLATLLDHMRTTFGLSAAAILAPAEHRWVVLHAAGEPVPSSPADGEELALRDGNRLVLVPGGLPADERRILSVFTAQVDAALERERLLDESAAAAAASEADRLRTAILRAVSHDLRTPLASIKASVTSLQQQDVEWSDDDRHEFLATIDEESDRLDRLVGNLLDMSRLESGTLTAHLRSIGLDEVIWRSVRDLAPSGSTGARSNVQVKVPEDLPDVVVDPVLLERVLANLVTNALTHAPASTPVLVEAGRAGGHVDIRVVDRGPGIRPDERDTIFEPFQRLGDSGGSGVGLGLAVAKGFTEAMGGELTVDDTPGGGLTVVVSLPAPAPSTGPAPAASPPEREELLS
jgi:two-component system sensor histidine kinase KdpD